MNKKISTKFFICLGIGGIFFICTQNAFAYLDPGTGSMILQSILGALFFIGTGIGIFWDKLKGLFTGSKDKSEQKSKE